MADAKYLKTPLLESFKTWNSVCLKSNGKLMIDIDINSFFATLNRKW